MTAAERTEATAISRIRFSEKLGFATFSASSNIVFNFRSIFYLFFLTNVMGIEMKHAGIITATGIVWDAVNDPMVGFWATNHRFKNGEKCRPLAFWCAVPWAVTVVLLFTAFSVTYWLKFALAIFIYFVFELFNTFAAIPYNSMGSLATNLDADRRAINIARNLGGCFGSGIGSIAPYPLLKAFGGIDAEGNILQDKSGQTAFLYSAMVMGCVCMVGCFTHYFTTKERVRQRSSDESRLSFRQVFKMLLSCRSWVMNTLYIICYGIVIMLIMSNITYYATYILGSAARATPILAGYLAVAVAFSLLAAPIDRRLGRKNTMIFAAAVYIAGKLWFVINPYSMGAILVNTFSVAAGVSLTFVMFSTNRNNIVDIIEWGSGRRIDSLVSTCDNLASKLAEAAANFIMTQFLAYSGFDATLEAQPQSAERAICALLGWVPGLIAVAMLFIALRHPIEEETKAMLEDMGKI